jgi:hypothetical protein
MTRRFLPLLTLTVTLTAGAFFVAASPASACQPESCPAPSPVCQVLEKAPKLPQCIQPF